MFRTIATRPSVSGWLLQPYPTERRSRPARDRPLVSGSISKAAIINAKPLKVKVAIAAAKPSRAASTPTSAGNTAPMPRPAL